MKMSNNPARYELLIKQYLRSILNISAKFVRARFVTEKVIPISEIMTNGKRNVAGKCGRMKNSVCLISNKSRKHFKPCSLFNKIKWIKLRWLKTVSSTFQDVDLDGSLLPLFINLYYNHGIKKLPNHW